MLKAYPKTQMPAGRKTKSSTHEYSFQGKIWKSKGPGGWHFVTSPKSLSKKIRSLHGSSEEGWGRLKAKVTIGKTQWKTSIWFDTKADSYILPVKSMIRKKESLGIGSNVKVKIVIQLDV